MFDNISVLVAAMAFCFVLWIFSDSDYKAQLLPEIVITCIETAIWLAIVGTVIVYMQG